MTPLQHKRIATALKSRRTRLRNQSKATISLAAKLALLEKVKAVDARLHQHLADYFSLVEGA